MLMFRTCMVIMLLIFLSRSMSRLYQVFPPAISLVLKVCRFCITCQMFIMMFACKHTEVWDQIRVKNLESFEVSLGLFENLPISLQRNGQ